MTTTLSREHSVLETIAVPQTKLTNHITEFIRDTETEPSVQPFEPRCNSFAALAGQKTWTQVRS